MFSNLLLIIIIFFINNIPVSSRIVYKRNVGFVDHTNPSHEHLKRVSDDQNSAKIKKVKGIYLCDSENLCENIPEFDIAKNESFSCHDQNLGVVFRQTDPNSSNGSKTAKHAFLKKDKPVLTKTQHTSNVCYQIKRYHVNEHQMLIMIDENLILIDKQDESECVSNELYRNKKYYVYVLYNLGIYDEEEDAMLKWQALKDLVWYYLHLGFLWVTSKNIYRFFRFIYLLGLTPQRAVRGTNRNIPQTDIDDDYISTINSVIGRVGARYRPTTRALRSSQQ